jgi:PLP dependent protein
VTATAEEIARRLESVRARVEEAARRAGRDPFDVEIVCVTKKHPPEVIEAARAAGLEHVGENYVQELVGKREALAAPDAVAWHFVGRLQRNKAKFLAGWVALIHAVDSEPLARAISARAEAAGRVQPVLAAVNLGGEEQKSGAAPGALGELLAAIDALPGVRCDGLMTMPPLAAEPEASRSYFRALRELRDRHQTPSRPLAQLSMGTSGDFEVAVEEGATWIRLGTELLGPRPAAP